MNNIKDDFTRGYEFSEIQIQNLILKIGLEDAIEYTRWALVHLEDDTFVVEDPECLAGGIKAIKDFLIRHA